MCNTLLTPPRSHSSPGCSISVRGIAATLGQQLIWGSVSPFSRPLPPRHAHNIHPSALPEKTFGKDLAEPRTQRRGTPPSRRAVVISLM